MEPGGWVKGRAGELEARTRAAGTFDTIRTRFHSRAGTTTSIRNQPPSPRFIFSRQFFSVHIPSSRPSFLLLSSSFAYILPFFFFSFRLSSFFSPSFP
jgi:hypothetical protein